MIGRNTLKKYELRTIEGYFDLIIDSKINGNSDYKDYIKKLNRKQKRLFLRYIMNREDLFKFFFDEVLK